MTVSTGIIATIAGTWTQSYSGDNGPATSAALNEPKGVALDASGTHSITSNFSSFYSYYVSLLGNVYIADQNNHRIRKVTVSTGIITTFAGTGSGSYSGDNGPATSVGLNGPRGVALDALGNTNYALFISTFKFIPLNFVCTGNVYIADSQNHCIRKVTISTGIITTIAGTGTSSYSGDNGPATAAGLSNPCAIAIDTAGISCYICLT